MDTLSGWLARKFKCDDSTQSGVEQHARKEVVHLIEQEKMA